MDFFLALDLFGKRIFEINARQSAPERVLPQPPPEPVVVFEALPEPVPLLLPPVIVDVEHLTDLCRQAAPQMAAVIENLRQREQSGGIHIPPEARLMFYSMARLMRAKDIVETGYDAGYTTRALALTGATVIGIDNYSEYPDVKQIAQTAMEGFDNCKLYREDAEKFLGSLPPSSQDFIFIDDSHGQTHVETEASIVRRILRPGGILVMHDTRLLGLKAVADKVFGDWPRLDLPCVSPASSEDFGIYIIQRPR